MELLKSALFFIGGTLKRVQWYLPPLLLDPFDIAERLFKVTYIIPQWIAWLLFATGWFVAIILTYHELRMQKVNLEKKLDDRLKRKGIREKLGVFIEECRGLMVKCANEKDPPPQKEIEDLTTRLDSYLRSNLGDEYIARINSGAGLPMQATSISSREHRNHWGQLNRWMARLDQFIMDFKD